MTVARRVATLEVPVELAVVGKKTIVRSTAVIIDVPDREAALA